MNHLLNKDWEYVLHIYEEEMKESTGWGRGEEQAKLMVWQTFCIKPGAVAAPARRDHTWAAGSSDSAGSRSICTGGVFSCFFSWLHHRCSGFMIRDICRVWSVRSLSGLQLTYVKPNLSSRRRLRRILMNTRPSMGQENIPGC